MAASEFRILHVFRAPLGGLFRHVLDLTRQQVARGYAVGIVCDSTTGGEYADRALEALRPGLALGLARLPIRRGPDAGDVMALMRLARVCRQAKPNVIHGHGSKGGLFARLARAHGEVVRAYTPHGGSFNYRPGSVVHRVYMGVEGLLARRSDLLLFESEFIGGRFRAYIGEPPCLARVVHNGIGAAEFEPIDASRAEFDLLYVGELRSAKGVDTLIEALALLRQGGRRLTLLCVGSGPDQNQLAARAHASGVGDAVVFEGQQPIRSALGRARVMVIPSRAESLPYVILEAAAAAQPLVSTNVGGIPEIFVPLQEELIEPDDPTSLAEAITLKMDETDDQRSAKASRLSEFVRMRFCLQRMADTVEEGYRDALAARRIGGSPELALQSR